MAKRVQVVLSEDILSLGKDGDLVEVAPGYARNFLLPHGKALPVTPAVLKQVEHRREVIGTAMRLTFRRSNAHLIARCSQPS